MHWNTEDRWLARICDYIEEVWLLYYYGTILFFFSRIKIKENKECASADEQQPVEKPAYKDVEIKIRHFVVFFYWKWRCFFFILNGKNRKMNKIILSIAWKYIVKIFKWYINFEINKNINWI